MSNQDYYDILGVGRNASDDEIKEYLALDAQILGLAQPVPVAQVFDFTLQREINKELGIK